MSEMPPGTGQESLDVAQVLDDLAGEHLVEGSPEIEVLGVGARRTLKSWACTDFPVIRGLTTPKRSCNDPVPHGALPHLGWRK
jgi:hypothetical protein